MLPNNISTDTLNAVDSDSTCKNKNGKEKYSDETACEEAGERQIDEGLLELLNYVY